MQIQLVYIISCSQGYHIYEDLTTSEDITTIKDITTTTFEDISKVHIAQIYRHLCAFAILERNKIFHLPRYSLTQTWRVKRTSLYCIHNGLYIYIIVYIHSTLCIQLDKHDVLNKYYLYVIDKYLCNKYKIVNS